MIGFDELTALAGTLDELAARLPDDHVALVDQEKAWWTARDYDPEGAVLYCVGLANWIAENRPEMADDFPGALAAAMVVGLRLGIIAEGG